MPLATVGKGLSLEKAPGAISAFQNKVSTATKTAAELGNQAANVATAVVEAAQTASDAGEKMVSDFKSVKRVTWGGDAYVEAYPDSHAPEVILEYPDIGGEMRPIIDPEYSSDNWTRWTGGEFVVDKSKPSFAFGVLSVIIILIMLSGIFGEEWNVTLGISAAVTGAASVIYLIEGE